MLKRKIVFYRWLAADPQGTFDLHRVIGDLAGHIAADPHFAVVQSNEVATAIEVVDVGDENSPTNVVIYALRSPENRPLQWEPGQPISAIQLEDGQYPADVTHLSIFPDGFAAQDAHGYAPRPGRLSFFLRKKMREKVSFEPLFTPNMIERMRPLKGRLRGAQIAFTQAEYTGSEGGSLSVLWPQALRQRVPVVRLDLSMGRYGPRDRYLDNAVDDAVFELAENANDVIEKLVVRGKNPNSGVVEEINLLNERLHVDGEFAPSASAASLPARSEVFFAIDQAYKEFHRNGILERAVHAQLLRE
ncbi:hypothetical protein [Streptomyces sp. WAC08401]|uniref:hypothetical protein n=1 Tax=Streptomyces sp. WAC08401 TaxID=2487413 RepID=UPI000FB3027A|nr:hypothetical protein [Streptomyces sp. WAC08401]RSS14458.1 hypothetical protein EF915_15840 [Streptomyces sp. WAC08401]